jgi:hypothetical protein
MKVNSTSGVMTPKSGYGMMVVLLRLIRIDHEFGYGFLFSFPLVIPTLNVAARC